MRFLIIGINYHPELIGIGKYTGEMAEWLAQQGHEVRVVTAPPYYPDWMVHKGYSAWRYICEETAGIRVFRCPVWVPCRPSGFKRILHLLSFGVSSIFPTLWFGIVWRPDWVLSIEPPLVCAPAVLLAGKMGGSRSWLHVQDFEVDAAFELGILSSKRLRRWVLAAESWLMQRFARVSTISERMLERLATKGVPDSRRVLFQNWVELDRVRPLDGASPLRAEWGLGVADIVVLYSGNMGEKQGLDILLEVARKLRDKSRIVFVLCGEGAVRSRLMKQAEGAPNIRFKPLQPPDQLNDLLNLADIHILPQRANAADLVLPSKLTNMLASGRPVVATAHSGTQVAELVKDCGIVVPPGEASALADAVVSLAESEERRQELGSRARELAEKRWSKEKILSQLIAVS
ncbi:MAG TPA: glycosyltransferase WbuB [Gammaproteobacteria bacterium]|nr:glycosyltransferase WbuB [Gammaproteobacteria bacterium]